MTQLYPENFARFYDVIYHQLRDGVDNAYFINEISRTHGRILEVGVGTGRLFIDALHQGADVFGIDISQSMIEVLSEKLSGEQAKRISLQNVIDFSFDFKFDLIIAPFRVLMHVLEKEEQLLALNNIYKHLNEGGRFIFDAFIQAHDNLETDQHYLRLHKPILAEFQKMGFYSLDLYPLYQAEMRARNWSDLSEWWISKQEAVDAHPDPDGQAFIAEQLIKYTLSQPELSEVLKVDTATAQKFLSKGD